MVSTCSGASVVAFKNCPAETSTVWSPICTMTVPAATVTRARACVRYGFHGEIRPCCRHSQERRADHISVACVQFVVDGIVQGAEMYKIFDLRAAKIVFQIHNFQMRARFKHGILLLKGR